MLIFTLILIFSNCNQEPEIIDDDFDRIEDFEDYLADEMDDNKIAAMSVTIFKEDQILYENYLGNSQIDQNISLENDHLFLLASVSKMVTATALLQLQEDGQFSLDDEINNFLPFEVEIPNYQTDITFQMLLTHTSGIADSDEAGDLYEYGSNHSISLEDFLESYFVSTGEFYNENENFYDFEPGTEHEYSNIGNALMGLLVQEISGMDFNEYCKQNIFNPLEMTHTYWLLDEISETIVQPYYYEAGEFVEIEHYSFPDYPNGGLRSTSRDFSKFLGAFVQKGMANNYQLLSANTIDEMSTPQIPSLDNSMGLHLFQLNAANNLWGHDGGEQGVSTIVGFNPTTKTGAIIFCNQEDVDLDRMFVEAYELGLEL